MLEQLGKKVLDFIELVGSVVLLIIESFRLILSGRLHRRNTVQQMARIGIDSFGLVFVTASFIGAVFTVQVMAEFNRLGAMKLIGGIVGLAMWRELAPVFTGVVVAGRIGAAISAEIGTMEVSEQIDALRAMAINPTQYLAAPRIAAAFFMLPLLTGIADVFGFFAGLLIAIYAGKLNPQSYFSSAQHMLMPIDIWGGMVKASIFGILIGAVACANGFRAAAGAEGVGSVTTKTVVASFILIFILNYVMSVFLYA